MMYPMSVGGTVYFAQPDALKVLVCQFFRFKLSLSRNMWLNLQSWACGTKTVLDFITIGIVSHYTMSIQFWP